MCLEAVEEAGSEGGDVVQTDPVVPGQVGLQVSWAARPAHPHRPPWRKMMRYQSPANPAQDRRKEAAKDTRVTLQESSMIDVKKSK